MPWTFDEIQQEWFGNTQLGWNPADVVHAFNLAERIQGREWVLGTELDFTAFKAFPGIGQRGGYSEFLRVYWFGKRMASIVGALGSEELVEKLIANDPSASEEASAIHILRSKQPDTELEIAPNIKVGNRNRRPDFRLRKVNENWIYVEVTKLSESTASIQIQHLLQRVTESVARINQAFLLEIIFNREPSTSEEEDLLIEVKAACDAVDGYRKDIGNFASILVKAGDPSVIIPSLIPDDNQSRMAMTQSVTGKNQPNRQIVARIPFQDQRAEDILRSEATQLPRDECGIVMVNVNELPSAFESWDKRIPERFATGLHTRVAAVILFMHSTIATDNGLVWIPTVKLILNPHAKMPLPIWIIETLDKIRADTKRLIGKIN